MHRYEITKFNEMMYSFNGIILNNFPVVTKLCGLVARIRRSHRRDRGCGHRGSIPRKGGTFYFFLFFLWVPLFVGTIPTNYLLFVRTV